MKTRKSTHAQLQLALLGAALLHAWPQAAMAEDTAPNTPPPTQAAGAAPLSGDNPTAPTGNVGEAGDPDRIVFEGLRTFSAAEIRHALAVKPSFLLASHPQANLGALLGALKTMVASGYQASGCPDVAVQVTYDAPAPAIRVRVTEGPRFTAGQIRVNGARKMETNEIVRWLSEPANSAKISEVVRKASVLKETKDETTGATWQAKAEASLTLDQRPGVLNTPGKASRPDEPMWVNGQPANFSAAWATQAVAQVEACVAEQGFFFTQAGVSLQRDPATDIADLLVNIINEGPPGVVDDLRVTGAERDMPQTILRFLDLAPGMQLTAARLDAARRQLRDCGRFWDSKITPEYADAPAPASHRVNLRVEVIEQVGVPALTQPLSPAQEALLRLCAWTEGFPQRDEDLSITVSHTGAPPFSVNFVLSPRHGMLLSTGEGTAAPVSAGFLLSETSVRLCAWASGQKLEAPRVGGGQFFLHLLPDRAFGSNRFNLLGGGGYSTRETPATAGAKLALSFDVQIARAALLDFGRRPTNYCGLRDGALVMTNDEFTLRADPATGRLLEARGRFDQLTYEIRSDARAWDQASQEFARRADPLTNHFAPGRGLSSLAALVASELARGWLGQSASSNAPIALRKLLNAQVLSPLDLLFAASQTNTFNVPLDEVDQAIGQNSLTALYAGYAFELSKQFFPKNSWPWTVTREMAFVLTSQGRYTDVEMGRLYQSDDTGPLDCLTIAHLLVKLGSPAAANFAFQGLLRLRTQDFLRDCSLFLRGDSGLARSFAQFAGALRDLPENERAALAASLPEAEAGLLRQAATALREKPDAAPGDVLEPILGQYWETTLRARTRPALLRLTLPPKTADKGAKARL